MTERRHDFDWIKTLVIISLFPFHVIWLMTFVSGFSQINTTSITSTFLQAYVVELGPWHMPLLFLIAGYSAAISLSRRSLYDYSWERFRRLAVPLVFYLFTKSLSEFFLLTTLTTILTILVYEFLVKPWSFSQFLLGVKKVDSIKLSDPE